MEEVTTTVPNNNKTLEFWDSIINVVEEWSKIYYLINL